MSIRCGIYVSGLHVAQTSKMAGSAEPVAVLIRVSLPGNCLSLQALPPRPPGGRIAQGVDAYCASVSIVGHCLPAHEWRCLLPCVRRHAGGSSSAAAAAAAAAPGGSRLEDELVITLNKALAQANPGYKRIGIMGMLALLQQEGATYELLCDSSEGTAAGGHEHGR